MPKMTVAQKREFLVEIYNYVENKNSLVINFLQCVQWESFVLQEAQHMLSNTKNLKVFAWQRDTLIDIAQKTVEGSDILDAVKYDNDSVEVCPDVAAAIYLISYFEYPINIDSMKELVSFPEYVFCGENNGEKYEYLSKYVPVGDILAKIEMDLKSGTVCRSTVRDHIEYCEKKKYRGIKDIAVMLCTDESQDELLQNYALRYLYEVFGSDCVRNEVVPFASEQLLLQIYHVCRDVPKEPLCKVMQDTATQQPLYSTLPDADDVVAIKGYSNTKMAVRPNQRIIMLNKGIGDKGFTICCDCGAAMPGDDPSVLKDIMRPYRSKFLRTRCKHNETKNVNLGYDFITDMLVLEIALDRQQVSMDLAKNSWLNRAGQSLAEALRLSACQELDIEFTELVTGFRVRQNQKGDFIDIYLYDSLSSGAGYAVSIEASIQQLLIKTRELLSSCNCDSACHKCLKHYRNQYVHGLLDRSAALDLLTWAEKGVRSPMLPVYEQRNLLQSVEQILQFSGVHIDFDHEPIEAESFHGKKRIVVYPAMWARPTEKNMVFVSDSYLKYAKPYALKTIVGGL